MNGKIIIGLLLGFAIGLGCSLFNIPVPAPPVLIGALLVVSMTVGYIATEKFICPSRPKSNADNCGGPTGD
jgi:XapX domain-containing protein